MRGEVSLGQSKLAKERDEVEGEVEICVVEKNRSVWKVGGNLGVK